ncbi:MAG: hypothetical protein MZV64_49855 [Ignavibacteriales bacterium]|nr:hypothetical protein [Ignavibacteriales bacterium]
MLHFPLLFPLGKSPNASNRRNGFDRLRHRLDPRADPDPDLLQAHHAHPRRAFRADLQGQGGGRRGPEGLRRRPAPHRGRPQGGPGRRRRHPCERRDRRPQGEEPARPRGPGRGPGRGREGQGGAPPRDGGPQEGPRQADRGDRRIHREADLGGLMRRVPRSALFLLLALPLLLGAVSGGGRPRLRRPWTSIGKVFNFVVLFGALFLILRKPVKVHAGQEDRGRRRFDRAGRDGPDRGRVPRRRLPGQGRRSRRPGPRAQGRGRGGGEARDRAHRPGGPRGSRAPQEAHPPGARRAGPAERRGAQGLRRGEGHCPGPRAHPPAPDARGPDRPHRQIHRQADTAP